MNNVSPIKQEKNNHPDQAILDLVKRVIKLRELYEIKEVIEFDDGLDAVGFQTTKLEKEIAHTPSHTVEGFLIKAIMSLEENMPCLKVESPQYIIEHQTIGMVKDLYRNEILQSFLLSAELTIEDILPHCTKQLDEIKRMI